MRKQPVMYAIKQTRRLRSPFFQKVGIIGILAVVWLAPLVSASAWVGHRLKKPTPSVAIRSNDSIATDTALWQHDTRTTAADYPLAPSDERFSVDPAFSAYYNSHNGTASLGSPLAPAYPTTGGTIQFFTAGALFLPSGQRSASQSQASGAGSDELLRDSLVDPASGILRLPLLHALLTAGSEARVGGPDGTLTYVNLRAAARPGAMVPAPAASSRTARNVTTTDNVFMPSGKQDSTVVGYQIPQSIYQYISQVDISPEGWQTDFGAPLTQALPLTATRSGSTHHLLVQLFRRGGVVEDLDAQDAAGNPTIERLDTGAAYLKTLGPPLVSLTTGARIWATGDTSIGSTPASTTVQAHVGQNFPLTLTGGSTWLNGELWYGVKWQEPKQSGSGWVPASTTTMTSPGSAPAWATFDVLSPDLAAYLNGLGSNVGAVVYDETRGQYYTYNPNGQFIMASSAKVPIMLTFLSMTEQQGREPNADEMNLLTTMIENSDNDSAQALFDEIGGTGPMVNFARAAHVNGLNPNPDAWGWSTISPLAMVQFLTLLHDGKVLTAQDRALALNLMENIESDQQTGVGDTAPNGATVAMKDGWVNAPDGLWAMNSSGIVTVGSETYIIAVYSQEDNQLSDGWTITQHVAGTVGKLLTQ